MTDVRGEERHAAGSSPSLKGLDLDAWPQQVLALVNSIDAVVWEADANFNGFTFVSEQAERLLGYPLHDWLTSASFWVDHMHPEDQEWCVSYCDTKARAGEDHDFEYRMIAADGRTVWLRDIVKVVFQDGRPNMLRGVMVDITESKEAAVRLKAQEDQYRRIFEATTDGLVISDVESGRILSANPAFCQMHGHDDMVGLLPADFIPPSSLHVFREKDQIVLRGQEFRGRAEHVRKDGSVFDVEVLGRGFSFQGRPAVLGIVRDISEQVRNEQAMEQAVRDRTQELQSLLGVTRALTSTLNLDELVRLILLELKRVVDYTAASVILLEGANMIVHDVVFDGDDTGPPTPLKVSIAIGSLGSHSDGASDISLHPCIHVASSPEFWDELTAARPVVIDDMLTNPTRIASGYRASIGDMLNSPQLAFMRSWAAIPLHVKGRTLGYVGVASATPGFLSEKHIRLAAAFADHASIAIENARLYEQAGDRTREIERRRAVAEGLRELLTVVNSGRNIDEILDAVVNQARRLLESDASQIFLPMQGVEGMLDVRASAGMEPSHFAPGLSIDGSAVGLAFKLGRPVAVPDVAAAYAFTPPSSWDPTEPLFDDEGSFVRVRYLPLPTGRDAAERSRSFSQVYHGFLAVPLVSRDQTYGVLTLSYYQGRVFTPEEIELAAAFAGQASLGVENARLGDQAQQLAAVEERQRLAHDLHDSVAQVLYGIALGARTAKKHLETNPETVSGPVDYISTLAAAGLAEMRALIFDLQPDSLANDGLLKALDRQFEALVTRHGLKVDARIDSEPDVSLEAKEAVYRVIREALHNVVKHAQATTVVVEVKEGEDALTFQVQDDGCGFDTGAEYAGHLGLRSMRGRLERLGGRIELASAPTGTTIRGWLPAG